MLLLNIWGWGGAVLGIEFWIFALSYMPSPPSNFLRPGLAKLLNYLC